MYCLSARDGNFKAFTKKFSCKIFSGNGKKAVFIETAMASK